MRTSHVLCSAITCAITSMWWYVGTREQPDSSDAGAAIAFSLVAILALVIVAVIERKTNP